MYRLAVPFTDLNEEVVFGFAVVGVVLLAQNVDPGAKTVENAVHLADGHRHSMLECLDSGRKVVECAFDHAVYPCGLSLSPIGYISHQSANLVRLGADGGADRGQVLGDGS